MIPVPTWRLAAAAAMASLLVLVLPVEPGWLLVAVNGLLLVFAAGDWAAATSPATVPVERDLPGVVQLGGDAEVTWRVGNPTGRSLRLSLADELAPSLGAATRRATLVVPRHGQAVARTPLRPARSREVRSGNSWKPFGPTTRTSPSPIESGTMPSGSV